MSAQQVAAEHARSRARLAEQLRRRAAEAWALVDPTRISDSWALQIPRLLLALTAGQYAAANAADQYLTAVLTEQELDAAAVAAVNPAALAGIASDGRPLASLLAQPGITARVALSEGRSLAYAMASGGALAELIGHTQVADAGRVADQVALTARPDAGGYVRMVVGKTCSRCLILAGKVYRWNTGFRRHPKCDCTHIPSRENVAGDLRTDPRRAFEAMPAAEQDRVFGKAGAAAIRDGADPGQVANARRGMQTAADGRLYTTEGATRRGLYGGFEIDPETGALTKRARGSTAPPRLMPEQILRDANGNRDDAIRLLRLHGYLV